MLKIVPPKAPPTVAGLFYCTAEGYHPVQPGVADKSVDNLWKFTRKPQPLRVTPYGDHKMWRRSGNTNLRPALGEVNRFSMTFP